MSGTPPGVERLRDGVDAVLVPAGFAPAQGSCDVRGSGGAGGWVWCAERTALARSHPALLHVDEDDDGDDGGAQPDVCVDVVVEVVGHRGAWRTTGVRLEARELGEVLADLGDDEGAEAARALSGCDGADLDVADGALVPELLQRVLDLGRGPQPTGRGSVRGRR